MALADFLGAILGLVSLSVPELSLFVTLSIIIIHVSFLLRGFLKGGR